jgi:hypothetical protein
MADTRSRLAALAIIAAIFALPVIALFWMTAVPGASHTGPLPPLTNGEARLAARLRGHVTTIASVPHNVEHPIELERAARHIEAALAGMGYTVRRQAFGAGGERVRNIEVVIDPAAPDARTLVVGAHYDSAYAAPGANDNATGTAAVIELARSLADLRGTAALRIRLVLFVNEEPPWFQTPLMGSVVYAAQLKRSGEPVLGMISLETLGYYSDRPGSQHYPWPLGMLYPDTGNFVAFVGTTDSRGFVRKTVGAFRSVAHFPSVGGTAPSIVQGVDWSDHWAFTGEGMPALMVTDTAPFRYPWYHSTADTPDKVDYDRLARVVAGLDRTIRAMR